jgi:DNA-binding transcriptional regulator YiaG
MSSTMKHFEQQSYYELLEIPPTATEEQILDAYARAMETYSPDSIAVYTLADPEQLESLRQQLTRAMETLSELDKRLEYDRSIGMKRSEEEVARLRAEGLKRVAEASPEPKSASGEGEPPAPVEAAPAQPPAVEVKSAPEEAPAVEAKPPEAPSQPDDTAEAIELVETVEAAEVAPEAEPRPVSEPPPAARVEAVPEPVAAAPAEPAAPTPAEAPVPAQPEPAAAAPVVPPATSGLPRGIGRHGRPSSPLSRPGAAVPPPLPPRGPRPPLRSAAEIPRRPESEELQHVTPPPPAQERGRVPVRPIPGQLGEAPVLAQASAIATAESALAQVAVKARDSRTRLKTVVDIPSDAEFNGELLRQVREGRGLSLQMLADRTRISSRHVENIEADRYDGLPAAVYLRGMLMSIARELGLDPLRVSRSYMTLVSNGEKKRR